MRTKMKTIKPFFVGGTMHRRDVPEYAIVNNQNYIGVLSIEGGAEQYCRLMFWRPQGRSFIYFGLLGQSLDAVIIDALNIARERERC